MNTLSNHVFEESLLPFEEIFIQRIELAEKELFLRAGTNTHLVQKRVFDTFKHQLLSSFSAISEQVLKMEFTVFLSQRQSALDRLICASENPPSRRIYSDFIQHMLNGGFNQTLVEYPVLGQLLTHTTAMWIDNLVEFFERLNSDLPKINECFSLSLMHARISAIKTLLSDRHHHGKSVMILTFETGLKLVYKPRKLELENACFGLLDWLNRQSGQPYFKLVKILDRDSYGWMEYVPHIPYGKEDSPKMFYQRAGALICVLHCLRATDCHFENIIAHGSYPVLIDMETLFHQNSRELRDTSMEEKGLDDKFESVLRTGFLPGFYIIQDDISYDLCGLGTGSKWGKLPKRLQWLNINTDHMHQANTEEHNTHLQNLPCFQGQPIPPNDHVEDIAQGFKEMYQLLEKNKYSLLSDGSPLMAFRNLHSRFVFRQTRFYTDLLVKSLEPMFLRDSDARKSIIQEVLHESITNNHYMSCTLLLKAEQDAIEKLDIPYFMNPLSGTSLISEHQEVLKNCFTSTSIEAVQKRVNSLNGVDLKSQLAWIRRGWKKNL